MKKLLQNRKIFIGLCVFIGILLVSSIVVPFIFAKQNPNLPLEDRNWFGPIYYGVCLAVSFICIIIYSSFYKKINIWALLSFISIFVANIGYLSLSLSNDISKAILANEIAYLGNVFLLPLLFMTIANICKINIKRPYIHLLFAVAAVMFVYSLTQGHLNLFYVDAKFEMQNGFVRIVKEYGPLHTVYVIYIVIMMLLNIGIAIFAFFNKKTPSVFCTILILVMGLINVILWLVERLLPYTIEYIAASFVLTEIGLLFIYKYLEKRGAFDFCNITFNLIDEDNPNEKLSITVNDVSTGSFHIDNVSNELLLISEEEFRVCLDKTFGESGLTDREKEVVYLMIKGFKRKQIAEKFNCNVNDLSIVENQKKLLSEATRGQIVTIANREWIVFKQLENETTQIVSKNFVIENVIFDNDSNNYANSSIRKWLNEDFYKELSKK